MLGFGMGGGLALARAASGFDIAAVHTGQLSKNLEATLTDPRPLVGSYGARDRYARGAAAILKGALGLAGVAHDTVEYHDAGHAFKNDAPVGPRALGPLLKVAGMVPEPTAASEVWRHTEEFFVPQLVNDRWATRTHRDLDDTCRRGP